MIITVSLNPAIDKTAELDALYPGQLNRLRNVLIDIGGKGVNVSKTISALGGTSVATGFVGGMPGEDIVRSLELMGIEADFVRVSGITRTNLKILDRGTRLTELNEPGVSVSPDEITTLTDKLYTLVKSGVIFVLSGSLAQGMDDEFYARLIRVIHNGGGLAYLDADGEAFKAAIEEKPDLIKPNVHELTEYFGISRKCDIRELKELCLKIKDKGINKIVLSLSADGAIFVNKSVVFAPALEVIAHSSVGAGDSMMGALAYATEQGMTWDKSAALAMATAAGAVTTVGTKPPDRQVVDELLKKIRMKSV
jgi:1-phosphofructokinase